MNTLYLRVKSLADEKNISLAQVERDLDFSAGLISKWKSRTANVDKVEQVAKYFNVTVDYLIGNDEAKSKDPISYYRIDTKGLNDSEVDDIKKQLDQYTAFLKSQLKNNDPEE